MNSAYVTGVGCWAPGFRGPRELLAAEADPEVGRPPCAILPPRQQRATSLVTRMGAEVIDQALTNAAAERSQAHLVFGSAYGEIQTAVDQMVMIEDPPGCLSPARFKNSVHNTVVGLLSIAMGNRQFHTALAAGQATFAMALLESLSVLHRQGGQLVVAVADEYPASPFSPQPRFSPLAVALCLAAEPPPAACPSPWVRLTGFGRRNNGGPDAVPEVFRANPAAAALPLLEAVLERRASTVPVELEAQQPYCISVEID